MPKLTALPAGTTLATAVEAMFISSDCQKPSPGSATIQFGPNVNKVPYRHDGQQRDLPSRHRADGVPHDP
jgi:hypothetical protein